MKWEKASQKDEMCKGLPEAPKRSCLALNVAIDTIGEEASWSGGAAQVHNGKHLSRGAGKCDVVRTGWHQGLSLCAILRHTHTT